MKKFKLIKIYKGIDEDMRILFISQNNGWNMPNNYVKLIYKVNKRNYKVSELALNFIFVPFGESKC